MPFTVYVIKLTATNIANGFEEDSTHECFLANGLNIEDSRMFSVAPISRYTVYAFSCFCNIKNYFIEVHAFVHYVYVYTCTHKHTYHAYMLVHVHT